MNISALEKKIKNLIDIMECIGTLDIKIYIKTIDYPFILP